MKRLYKIEKDKKIFGVCGGVAEYFDIDPTVIRVIWALLGFGSPLGLPLYVICAIIFPKKSEVFPYI